MKKLITRLVFCFIIIFVFSQYVLSSDNSTNNIIFLHLQINSNEISLIESQIADGTFKEKRFDANHGSLYYEIISDKSEILRSATIKNPLVREYEYEDPDNPDRLLKKIVHLNETEFTIRINSNPDIKHVEFYLLEEGADLKTRKSTGRFLGAVAIDNIGEGE